MGVATGATIETLRITSAAPDPQGLVHDLSRFLTAVNWQPQIPTAAILCVRSVRGPALKISALVDAYQPASLNWGQTVRAGLDDLARQAVRPIAGAVPANAPAVLFADLAEWLACLAIDWMSGQLTTHWWWHGPRQGRSPAVAVLDAWRREPEHIPAALELLAARQQAVPFVLRLGDLAAREVTLALARTYGLAALHAVIQAIAVEPAPAWAVSDRAARGRGQSLAISAEPPWTAVLSEAEVEALTPAGQMLIGVGLTLHRSPQRAHAQIFARQAAKWLAEAAHAAQPDSGGTASAPAATQTQENWSALAAPARAEQPLPAAQPRAIRPPETTPGLTSSRADVGEISADPVAQYGMSYRPVSAQQTDALTRDDVTTTEYAGCLYLINLGLFLGLYADFTTPLTPGLELPIWDFVALVAFELIGPALRDDPFWPLLARLAGRAAAEPPGFNFTPPGEGALEDWLATEMVGIRARLCLALAVEAGVLGSIWAAHGRIVVTAARLEAFLSLSETHIAVRLSGLDRDPGWVPAAGRTILFHFD